MWLSGAVSIFILFWTTICARKDETSVLLTRLLSPRSLAQSAPIIIIVDPENQLGLNDDKSLDVTSEDSGDVRDDETPDDEDAYLLYTALRTQPQDHLNPSEVEQLEETKQVLREALRARCNKLDKCVKKCPKKKKNTCASKCQKKIDKKNVCGESDDDIPATEEPEPECEEEEEKCGKKQKWGKTLPPDWLLRYKSK